MKLLLGSPVSCVDGAFGELVEVVVDPLARSVAHLVVEPHHRHWLARLVPIALVAGRREWDTIALHCTIAEARRLELVQHSAFLRLGDEFVADDPAWDVGADGVLVLPYYGSDAPPARDALETAVYDRIPKGEIEIRRASAVMSADGRRLGHVEGLVVDGDEHITHVLLERGHLWGKREITVPIGAVTDVRPDAITLRLTGDEVGELEPVAVRRHR
jgi:sporulation protein YlmC with PRC-barrel domain